MSKGLRFFGTDYNNVAFGNTVTVSSRDGHKDFMFDGLVSTKWISDGEDTDGNAISIEIDYGTNRTFDCIYIYNTNIEDIEAQYWSGSAWVTLNASVATITKSSDYKYVFIQANASITTTKIKIVGEDTITADQEKYVTLIFAFLEIGQFEYFPEFKPKISNFQSEFSLTDSRGFVIERGESFESSIQFKSHVNQNDIDLAETLLERKQPFFIWPNGGDDDIFTYSFRPFRFKDIFKVAIVGDNAPEFTKNYYKSGYNNKINLREVS